MDLFCKGCGIAFSRQGNFCSRCGASRGGEPRPPTSVNPQTETPIEALGINLPPSRLKLSDRLDENFYIGDHYSLEEMQSFYKVLNQILDVSDVHGFEHVVPALDQLGQAGSSAAWRTLAEINAQKGEVGSVRRYVGLAVLYAFNRWEVLLAATVQGFFLCQEIQATENSDAWRFGESLRPDVVRVTGWLRDVISHLYPDSEELRGYMAEDVEGTRRALAEAGKVLHNMNVTALGDGEDGPHLGLLALGLTLLIDFGSSDQREWAEEALIRQVTLNGKYSGFAEKLLEVEEIKPKLVELGVWRWG